MTYNNSQGISGKIISISLIWYPVFKNFASGEAAVTSGKSGLMCSALKMLISVLSDKAVLGYRHKDFNPMVYQHNFIALNTTNVV